MRDRELKIEGSDDGFVLIYQTEVRDGIWETEYVPVEDLGDEQDLFRRLLDRVAEYFGMEYNKWNPSNLNITFDKRGHKVE